MFSAAVRDSLKSEILKELSEGDFDRKKCRRVKKMLGAAEQFLMLDKISAPEVIADDVDDDGNYITHGGAGMVAYGGHEDMNTRLIREVVAMLPGLLNRPPDPERLVGAIAEARVNGLDEVAAQLTARLLGTTAPAPAAANHQPSGEAVVDAASAQEDLLELRGGLSLSPTTPPAVVHAPLVKASPPAAANRYGEGGPAGESLGHIDRTLSDPPTLHLTSEVGVPGFSPMPISTDRCHLFAPADPNNPNTCARCDLPRNAIIHAAPTTQETP